MTSDQYEAAIEAARARGAEDGKAAGSWVVDGNTSEEALRRLLEGLDEGDPEVLDSLPAGPLSGEFADGLLPRDLLASLEVEEDDEAADDILRAYEDAWSSAVQEEAERSARAMLPEDEDEDDEAATISQLAKEAAGFFTRSTRPDGETTYVHLLNGRPDWVQELARDAHGDFLPDDWKYATIEAALDHIGDGDYETADDAREAAQEFADGAVDVYTSDRYEWLSSNLRRGGYVDQARDDFGASDSHVDDIGRGQYLEAQEIYEAVVDALETRLEA